MILNRYLVALPDIRRVSIQGAKLFSERVGLNEIRTFKQHFNIRLETVTTSDVILSSSLHLLPIGHQLPKTNRT